MITNKYNWVIRPFQYNRTHVIPKLSMSVKASLRSPVHCLEILPTSCSSSGVITLNSTSLPQAMVHQGPLITRATFPSPSVISNLSNELWRMANNANIWLWHCHMTQWPQNQTKEEQFDSQRDSLVVYFGLMQLHLCLTVPMTLPGGALTSSSCRQQGKRQEEQR